VRDLRTAILMLVLLVAGCSPAPSSSATDAPLVSPEPAATASATPASSGPTELTLGADPLPSGLYTRAGFRPPVTLVLDQGWSAGTLSDGFFDVQQDKGTPDVIAVQFAQVEATVGPDGSTVAAASAQEAAETIKANPGLTVLDESESRLGGLAGFNLEVENSGGSHAPILDVPVGRLGIDSGRRLWISLFDTDDGLLAVMVGGSVAQWDRALRLAEPVLESIVIGSSDASSELQVPPRS